MQRSQPSRQSLHLVPRQHRAQLLDRQGIVAAHARQRRNQARGCPSGAAMPTFSAMSRAVLPTSAGLGSRCAVTSAAASLSISCGVQEVGALPPGSGVVPLRRRRYPPPPSSATSTARRCRTSCRARCRAPRRPGRRCVRCNRARCRARRRTQACRRCRRRAPAPSRRSPESRRRRGDASAPACLRASRSPSIRCCPRERPRPRPPRP